MANVLHPERSRISSDAQASLFVLARESRALTQAQLAQDIGQSQGTVSKVENGQIQATEDIVSRYSERLRYPSSFFSQSLIYYNLPVTMYRKRQTMPAIQLKAIKANVILMCNHIHRLNKAIDLPDIRLPRVRVEDYNNNINDIAADIRRNWNLPSGPIDNITSYIEDCGVLVMLYDFGTLQIDGLSMYDPISIPPLILVNDKIPGDRQRHTLAHEFAHLVLHHHEPLIPPTRDIESEADLLASELLVPSKDIKPYLGDLTIEKLISLKPRWKVSIQSLLIKAYQLGKLSESRYKAFWPALARLGYRTKEPVSIPQEKPTTIEEIMAAYINDLQYTDRELCALLNYEPEDLYYRFPVARRGLRLIN